MARTKRSTTGEAHQMLELLNSLGGSIFRQLLWQKSSDLDLTYAQSQVLFRLAEHPGSHMGDVAKAFGVTLPAVTHIVDRLEEKGLVTRGDHPADRRVYVLDLTSARQGARGRARGDPAARHGARARRACRPKTAGGC
jgi:DNA-binding MarR family transcriptional regulator